MKYKKLVIEYGNDNMPVEYELLNYSIVQRWADRLRAAQEFPYPIDHPERFYGFGSWEDQALKAVTDMNQLCDKIKSFGIPVEHKLENVFDQDTLNYLHHIFEEKHGLLDIKNAGPEVLQVLSELNIMVHRCESIQRGARPRHVVTYFGLPKTTLLEIDDYQHFTNHYTFGTVYLNYVEIGKTLEDLTVDNDTYIHKEAFQPFRHYSADFNVKFFDIDHTEADAFVEQMKKYYNENINFFKEQGLEFDSPYLQPGSIPVAKIITKISLSDIESRQCVRSVRLYE
jgi:hypothetical protein